MQLTESDEAASNEALDLPDDQNAQDDDSPDTGIDDGVALDVSGKSLEYPATEKTENDDAVESLYMYKNVYSLIPKSVGGLVRLRTLKFFGNELNLFAPEFGNMIRLERLQMKISSPGIGGLPLHKLEGLKELELSKGPSRPSAFSILTEIAALKCLTKLSICHFSIRYLPPEIGCLKSLEYLDLSFNKMKKLPSEISCLIGLISMKVANNKLVELPSDMTSLSRLESLDLSNNRLTSLGSLELGSMRRLQNLNLQYNKLSSVFQIPTWICCNLEGNDGGRCQDSCSSSSVEMDVYESSLQENDETLSHGPQDTSSSVLMSSSSCSRCFAARKSGKRWKRQRRHYLQQKGRQEWLNNSRKWKGIDHDKLLSKKIHRIYEPGNLDTLGSDNCAETVSDNGSLDGNNKRICSEDKVKSKLIDSNNNDEVIIEKQFPQEDCLTAESKDEKDASSCSSEIGQSEQDEAPCSEFLNSSSKSKRHSDQDLDNAKPCKHRKPIGDRSLLSRKYSKISFCGIEDHLSDGFYDAGRDRPFMPLESYEQNQCLASREVILLDRHRDEELDAILLSARALVYNLVQLNGLSKPEIQCAVDDLQKASLLALFVSDHFGGSDRGAIIERTRKSVSGSNYNKPFVCTCSTGSNLLPQDLSTPVSSGTGQGSGEYFSRLGVGQPAKPYYMVLDTGSDVNWIQCKPCSDCYQQTDPIYDPTASSSFEALTCEAQQCQKLEVSACRSGKCLYQVSYGDGSFTVGDYITETVSFGESGSVKRVAIGCGHDNEGLFVAAAGLLGLGGGPLSLTSQIKATSFSYCLVDRDSGKSSTLEFNSPLPGNSVTAPLLKNQKLDTFYYVGLAGMSVGGEMVSVPPETFAVGQTGTGGIIVDSGTAITRLQAQAYNSVRDAFKKLTQNLRSAEGFALFDTCYDMSNLQSVRVPTVVFHFAGGKSWNLPAKNYLIPVDSAGTYCFAFAPTSSALSIIGNVQQQGTRVTYDLANSLVGFSPNNC